MQGNEPSDQPDPAADGTGDPAATLASERSDVAQRIPARRITMGQLLTLFANLGVVIGLVFVGLELQQTRVSMQADVELTLAQSYQVLMGRSIELPHVAEIILMANTQPEQLEPVQFVGILAWTAEALNLAFATWQLREMGAIEEATYRQHVTYIAASFQAEFMQGMWRDNLNLYPEAFQVEMAGLLSENAAVFDTIQIRDMIGN